MSHDSRSGYRVNIESLASILRRDVLNKITFCNVLKPISRHRNEAGCSLVMQSCVFSWLPRSLTATLLLASTCAFADSYWQGGTSDFNVPGSWNPSGVPSGVNAINDSGSNNVVLTRPGDPVWSPWDIRAGDGAGASGSYLQTGSTNVANGWFRLGDNANSAGYYTLSNGTLNVLLQAHVGEAGVGVLTINGGTFTAAENPFCMGDGDFGAGGNGTLNMKGGTLTIVTDIRELHVPDARLVGFMPMTFAQVVAAAALHSSLR